MVAFWVHQKPHIRVEVLARPTNRAHIVRVPHSASYIPNKVGVVILFLGIYQTGRSRQQLDTLSMGDESPGPVVNLDPQKSPQCNRAQRQKVVDRVVPILVLGINGYILYAFCYEVVWKWVDPRGVRIAIYAILGFLNFMMMVSWAAVHLWGPGSIDSNYTRIDSPDEPFVCGEDGYTPWCSHCQHFKPARAHHSSTEGRCIPVMDHFCIWLGKVIGQGNLKFFLQYIIYAWSVMVLILVVQFRYQNQQLPHIAAQAIPVYVISGFWFMFITALLAQHFFLLLTSQTTLENMDTRKKRYAHFNIPFHATRRVIPGEKSDFVPGPYHEGYWQNCVRVLGPWYTWLLPIRGPISEQSFNRTLLKKLQARQEVIEAKNKALSSTPSSSSRTAASPDSDPSTSTPAGDGMDPVCDLVLPLESASSATPSSSADLTFHSALESAPDSALEQSSNPLAPPSASSLATTSFHTAPSAGESSFFSALDSASVASVASDASVATIVPHES